MVVETALYERLGVAHNASVDEIRRSYRRAALLWHPDRNQGDPAAADKFKACLEAYEILSNPDRRAVYDAHGLRGILRTAPSPSSPAAAAATPTQPAPQPAFASAPFGFGPFSAFFDADPSFAGFSTTFGSAAPQGSFSSSWSFQSSSTTTGGGGGDGTYTTHYQTWNSRDGLRSGSRRGTFAPGVVHSGGFGGFGGLGGFGEFGGHSGRGVRDAEEVFFDSLFGSVFGPFPAGHVDARQQRQQRRQQP